MDVKGEVLLQLFNKSKSPGPTHQDYTGGESLATCGRFDRLEI